jgi:hypothetical protein
MKIVLKVILALFVVGIILIGIWFFLDKSTKCKLIYGKNICNFYEMINTQPSIANFDKMVSLCREMTNVPKKDSCFEFIAETFSHIDIEKAQQSCEEVKGFDGAYSKEDCFIKIQKPIEEKLAESAVIEFMTVRIKRDEEAALSWLTDNAKGQYLLRSDLPLTGLSNPHFTDFEILEAGKLNTTQFRFKIRIYEEYTGQGRVGYFDETLTIIKSGDKYLIDSFKRSEYTNL